MARVNLEDDLEYSGRLSKLSRTMKWTERETIGALYYFYRDTQRAGVIEANEDRIVTITVLRFDSDEEARRFIYAMITAQLATRMENGLVLIRGNQKHVDRMERLRGTAAAGGKARQAKKTNKFQAVMAEIQAENQAVGSAPSSQLLTPNSNTEETTKKDLTAGVRKSKRKEPSPEAAPSGVAQVRRLWLDEYQKRYGKPGYWGAREGGQCSVMLGTWPLEELLELVPKYFAWARPQVIRSGHPFGVGLWSFTMQIHELRADVLDPQRRRLAAQVQEREKLSDTVAVGDDQVNRINALMRNEEHHERLARATQRSLEQATTTNAGALGQGDPAAGQLPRAEPERPCVDDMVQGARPARDRHGSLDGVGSILRRGKVSEYRRGEVSACWQTGDATVQAAFPFD